MNGRRPIDLPAPSLHDGPARAVLLWWLSAGSAADPAGYREFRRGYEAAVLADLPAPVPRKLRGLLGRAAR